MEPLCDRAFRARLLRQALSHDEIAQYVEEVERRLEKAEALAEALREYADRDCWTLLPDDRPEATTKPYYPAFEFDGGGEPWKIASDALAVWASV